MLPTLQNLKKFLELCIPKNFVCVFTTWTSQHKTRCNTNDHFDALPQAPGLFGTHPYVGKQIGERFKN
jgi:hypothetical protein